MTLRIEVRETPWSHWVEKLVPYVDERATESSWCDKRGPAGEVCDWRAGHACPCSWEEPS